MISLQNHFYKTLSKALASIPEDNHEEVIIDLNGETFHEQVTINKPHVTLKNGTVEYDLGAYEILSDGIKRGTFRTYTLFIDADHVKLDNVNVINSNGHHEGQAIALMIDGNDFVAENSLISSYQDTIFLAPLPEKEYEAGGFRGPLENRERIMRNAWFENCTVEGSVDFIFGGGLGVFHNCEIRSRNIDAEINGYVCAPSTPENEKYGFIFNECDFTSEKDMDDSVYLARPWRHYGKCFILNSKIGSHIKKEGYHDWNKPDSHETCEFKEYNTGEDLNLRVSWLKKVNKEDLKYISSLNKEDKK